MDLTFIKAVKEYEKKLRAEYSPMTCEYYGTYGCNGCPVELECKEVNKQLRKGE